MMVCWRWRWRVCVGGGPGAVWRCGAGGEGGSCFGAKTRVPGGLSHWGQEKTGLVLTIQNLHLVTRRGAPFWQTAHNWFVGRENGRLELRVQKSSDMLPKRF